MNRSAAGRAVAPRFQALWQRCAASVPVLDSIAPQIYDDLYAHYAEPQRRYHTWGHVDHCLREFDAASIHDPSADALEMAIWFHDAIYVPGAVDNEPRSAALFLEYATSQLTQPFIDCVYELIMLTTHRRPPNANAQAWMIDIDLSSFGLAWPEFLRDSHDVRAEQAHIADVEYCTAQSRFLRAMSARARIFYTAHFYARYEQSARANIARLLALLETGTVL